MQNVSVGNKKIYYYDSSDPVIHNLKLGSLFGESNFRMLNYFINSGKTILDCGAHVGTFAIPALFSGYDVICVEAATKNIECLNETASQFYNKMTVIDTVLSDSVKRCDFSSDGGPFGWIVENEVGVYTTSTIDSICQGIDISGIKLDIEGGEEEALLGANETLKRCKPPIIIEINGHCLRIKNKQPQNVLETLYNLNYEVFLIQSIPLSSNSIIKINPKQKFPFCVVDLICLHKDSLSEYRDLRSIQHRELTDFEINNLIEQNYHRSNDDCKRYFDTIRSI